MSGPMVTGRPVVPGRQKRLLPPTRYRHPGDVIRLLVAGLVFAVAGAFYFLLPKLARVGNAFKLPSGSKLLLILAVIVAVTGLVLATRSGWRLASDKLIPGLRSAAASLRMVARRSSKMIVLVGGSALVTLAYIGALVASVEAFGGGPGFVLIGAVYMGAAALASVAPTPGGGLGAIEAALVAGLTGVGMSSGLAVSAVLLYRLATYWLPVAPGWVSLRLLQRRDYV